MNHTRKPVPADDCRSPIPLTFSKKVAKRRRLLSYMPLLATYCISLPACAQSPWSAPARQAQIRPAELTQTVQSTDSEADIQRFKNPTSRTDIIVRGQEPIPAALVSVPTNGAPATASNDQTSFRDFDAGELVAVVGTEHVLAGDMMVFIEPILEKNRGKLTPAQEKQLKAQLIRQVLAQ